MTDGATPPITAGPNDPQDPSLSAEGDAAERWAGEFDDCHASLDEFAESIIQVYGKGRDLKPALAMELPVWRSIYATLTEDLDRIGYRLGVAFAAGSTGLVVYVRDAHLRSRRALKIVRPRLERLSALLRLAGRERQRLNELRHANLVRLFFSGDIQVSVYEQTFTLPYFVMELIEPSVSLDDFLRSGDASSQAFLSVVEELAQALDYLHSHRLAHLDLKPANVLVAGGHPILVDLGYAKVMRSDVSDLTGVMVTKRFSHPDLLSLPHDEADESAVIIEVPYDQIRPQFDMYSLGATILALLDDRATRDAVLALFGEGGRFRYRYLRLIGTRLLDGVNARPGQGQSAEGLPLGVFEEIRYENVKEALDDIHRLLHGAALDSLIPELSITTAEIVVLPPPGTRVPFSKRVRDTVEHPLFARLDEVLQLGMLKLLFPGAVHSRWEHALGTLGVACRMLIAMAEDDSSPVFRSIMRRDDYEATMVAALLHDIAYYPLAHDLEDADRIFDHESLTADLLAADTSRATDAYQPLSALVESRWHLGEAGFGRVLDLLSDPTTHGQDRFRDGILRRIVSGPIDADKLDYLRRDSAHTGVVYGSGVDVERLLSCLTVAVQNGESVATFSSAVGITEKGRASAEAVALVRYEMFSSVYWHHTSRAMKTMLAQLASRVLAGLGPERRDDFRERLLREILLGGAAAKKSVQGNNHERQIGPRTRVSHTDRAMIQWLVEAGKAEPVVTELARCLLERRLYRRLAAIVAPEQTEAVPPEWVPTLEAKWINVDFAGREKVRERIQSRLVQELQARHVAAAEGFGQLPDAIRRVAILFDVPWKKGEHGELTVIMEGGQSELLHSSVVWQMLARDLNRSASIPRVFVHDAAHPFFADLTPHYVRTVVIDVLGLSLQRTLDM